MHVKTVKEPCYVLSFAINYHISSYPFSISAKPYFVSYFHQLEGKHKRLEQMFLLIYWETILVIK